jgi:membrane-bound lytic murein transglycosylase D
VSNHPRTIAERNWYDRHPKYLARTAERARPFLFHIVNEVEKRGFPLEIALLPIVESAFQPFAYSHGRAAGLWQFIPATGKRYGLRQNWWYDGRRDVVESTRAALDYLDYLQKEFDGDWLLALAAYNSGEGKVAREIRKNRQKGKKSDYWNLSLPRETRAYVPKLLALRDIVGQPDKFSLKLPEIANRPHFKVVEVGSQIDLALAAELAGLTVEELYRYNPGFNRWATPPSGPHRLVLPQQNSATFRAALADYPAERRISWSRHTIRRGETLSTIAMRYGTSVENLRRSNHLRSGSLIRAGDHLIIPSAMADASRYTLSADQRAIATATAGGAGKGASRRHHTVVSGDTLWSISRRYGVALASLARWNSLATRDTLRVGRELVIWSSKGTARTPPGPVAAIADKARKTLHYTVRSGDSLYGIARRYKVSVSDLQRWNKGVTNPARLSIGQRLTLHVDVTSL